MQTAENLGSRNPWQGPSIGIEHRCQNQQPLDAEKEIASYQTGKKKDLDRGGKYPCLGRKEKVIDSLKGLSKLRKKDYSQNHYPKG